MRKIPTLFMRDEADRRTVTRAVQPGCEWVLEGQGVATRKYDGTCVLIRRDGMLIHGYARREVKPGKNAPPQFRELQHDEVTGKTVGWVPIESSSFVQFFDEAIEGDEIAGTYELCGPKINGNPEGFDEHRLVLHGSVVLDSVPRDFDGLRDYLQRERIEGVVWHHSDGRMAKLKKRDFPPHPATQ